MLWLVKSSADAICWCECERALAVPPGSGQMGCPWCGCGWLFMCLRCRKAFTYARAEEVSETYAEIVHMDREQFCRPSTMEKALDALADRAAAARSFILKRFDQQLAALTPPKLVLGVEYAILDGHVLPLDAPAKFVGTFGAHDLPELPHRHRDAKKLSEAFSGSPYWRAAQARKHRLALS